MYTISRRAELIVWDCDTELKDLEIVEGTENQLQVWSRPDLDDEPKKKKTKISEDGEELPNKILYKRKGK